MLSHLPQILAPSQRKTLENGNLKNNYENVCGEKRWQAASEGAKW